MDIDKTLEVTISAGTVFPGRLAQQLETVLVEDGRVELCPTETGVLLRAIWWADAERIVEELNETLDHGIDVSEPRVVYKRDGDVLLEPVMKVTVNVSDDCMGDVMGDLNRRRGLVVGMDNATNDRKTIRSIVPLVELEQFLPKFRKMTLDNGEVNVDFHGYQIAPSGGEPDPDEPASAALRA